MVKAPDTLTYTVKLDTTEAETKIAELHAELDMLERKRASVARQPRYWLRVWDCKDHVGPAWRPKISKTLELWQRGWGEPLVQLTLEVGHRRYLKPRHGDLISQSYSWRRYVQGFGVFIAIAVARGRG